MEAYILALEMINSLSMKYRVENFLILLCNAWELILKSKLIFDNGNNNDIYYPAKKGERRRTLSLRDCLVRIFPNEKDPIRRNIERIAELRDECVHLSISAVPKDVMSLFQASVVSYHRKLVDWFDMSIYDRVPLGMMTLV